jgi:ribosome-binding protein aMBF1 (putative translation factor)
VEEFYRELGTLIRERRERRGLSHQKLAQKLGLKRTSITNIEAGNQRLSLYHAIKLSRELEISLEDLNSVFARTEFEADMNFQGKAVQKIVERSLELAKEKMG